jgi:hypothetical protein
MENERLSDELKARPDRHDKEASPEQVEDTGGIAAALAGLQRRVGNRAVQRMLAQRSGGNDGSFDLDDETIGRINRERGGGQPVDSAVQAKMSAATGSDLSDVKVHTTPESAELSQEVGAVAFTTGKDIFFNEGSYNPQSGGGQELLAHELTHVVQQSSGETGGGGSGMTVNAPGDKFEQEADEVARAVTSASLPAAVSAPSGARRNPEEDEVQMKGMTLDEEDEEELKKR